METDLMFVHQCRCCTTSANTTSAGGAREMASSRMLRPSTAREPEVRKVDQEMPRAILPNMAKRSLNKRGSMGREQESKLYRRTGSHDNPTGTPETILFCDNQGRQIRLPARWRLSTLVRRGFRLQLCPVGTRLRDGEFASKPVATRRELMR
jgi:hypothetical protein